MAQVFIVAWTGGYEQPSYVAKATLEEANVQAAEWLDDAKDEDTVEILVVNLDDFTIDRDEAAAPPTPVLPLPGDTFEARKVLASVWLNDDAPEPFALLLMLRDAAPYYELGDITWRDGGWQLSALRQHPNIVPAVEDYQQSGGDY